MRRGVALSFVLGLGCEAIAGYDSREPWVPGGDEAGVSPDASGPCLPPRITCGSDCADLTSSFRHCGACGSSCAAGEVCSGGKCTCAPGATVCGSACTDTRSDPTACGACASPCGAKEYCGGSTCKCRPGLVDCGGECVDTDWDPRHCGACGKTCDNTCWSGDCKPICAGGNTSCAIGGEKACVSTKADPLNCGECGKACAVDELCVDGGCKRYAPALGCDACPCDACAAFFGGAKCCPALAGHPSPICVAGDGCP